MDFMSVDENPFANDLPDWEGKRTTPTQPESAAHQAKAHENASPPVAAEPGASKPSEPETSESHAGKPEEGDIATPVAPKPARRIYSDPREEWGAVYPDEEEDETAVEEIATASSAPTLTTESEGTPTVVTTERTQAEPTLASESVSSALRRPGSRNLVITMRRTGDVNRDKYRLREIYELVRDARGRGKDAFFIRLDGAGGNAELSFPNDWCEINDKLLTDLQKRMRLGVEVITPQ
jgi:hypothetical protein